jgi:uncharacterized protein YkwD
MRRTAALVTAALALAAGVSSAEARDLSAAQSVEASINSARAERGCDPLRPSLALARSAGRLARLLLAQGELDHDAGTPFAERLASAAPSADVVGENLAWGAGGHALPSSVVARWLASPPHRTVMLDCRFSRLGVGIAAGQFGAHGSATVYAADFSD